MFPNNQKFSLSVLAVLPGFKDFAALVLIFLMTQQIFLTSDITLQSFQTGANQKIVSALEGALTLYYKSCSVSIPRPYRYFRKLKPLLGRNFTEINIFDYFCLGKQSNAAFWVNWIHVNRPQLLNVSKYNWRHLNIQKHTICVFKKGSPIIGFNRFFFFSSFSFSI